MVNELSVVLGSLAVAEVPALKPQKVMSGCGEPKFGSVPVTDTETFAPEPRVPTSQLKLVPLKVQLPWLVVTEVIVIPVLPPTTTPSVESGPLFTTPTL